MDNQRWVRAPGFAFPCSCVTCILGSQAHGKTNFTQERGNTEHERIGTLKSHSCEAANTKPATQMSSLILHMREKKPETAKWIDSWYTLHIIMFLWFACKMQKCELIHCGDTVRNKFLCLMRWHSYDVYWEERWMGGIKEYILVIEGSVP